MKAAIYLRQSHDRSGDELAVSRQREDCEKLCTSRGWDWVEYCDNDVSASNGKRRPAYEQMLIDIRADRVDAVVAWDADRLHRRPIELEYFIDLADQKQLALATVGGDFDLSTPTGRGNARMKGVFARMEMEQKSARQRRSARQRAEAGATWSAMRAFGYTRPNPGGFGQELVEDEAALLRDAYSGVLAGRSLASICKQWNAQGVTTPRGKAWSHTILRSVLLNERNAGIRTYRGEVVGKGHWPAIVEMDVFDGARAVLTDPARRPGKTLARRYLLGGLALCGCCGKPVSTAQTARRREPIYRCRHFFGVGRLMAPVDRFVTGVVVERLSRPDAAEVLVQRDRVDLAQLRDKANALRARQEELATQLTDLNIPVATVKARARDIAAQIADIESKLLDASKVRVFDGMIGVDDVRAKFDGLPLDRKRALINALMTVTIMPGQPPRGPFRTELVDIAWK